MLAYNVCIKENPQVVHFPPPPLCTAPPPKKTQHYQPRCFTDHFSLGVNHLTFKAGMGDFRKNRLQTDFKGIKKPCKGISGEKSILH